MSRFIYNTIYKEALTVIINIMAFGGILWGVLGSFFLKEFQRIKLWRIVNKLLLCTITYAIFMLTLYSRENVYRESCFIPFHSFVEAKIQPEMYRSMMMNVFLFWPVGLTLPYCLSEKWKRKILIAILCAMVVSVGIEIIQYYYHLGRAETDDIICNILGCEIGTLSYYLSEKIFYRRHIICKKEIK